MRVLAFDQSTLITGWAVFDDGKYVRHGMIDLHKHKDGITRFTEMCLSIRDVIQKYQPDQVVVEDVMYMKSAQALIVLARLQGVILGYCHILQIPVTIYLPTQWRKVLGFKQGRVTRENLKQQAIDLIRETYNLSVETDEADALCIALAHLKILEDNKNVEED